MQCRTAGLILRLSAIAVLLAALTARAEDARDNKRIQAIRLPDIVKIMAIKPGDTVADVGAADGIYTVPLARTVGPTGRVYAIDINENVLRLARRRVKRAKLSNVTVIRGAEDNPKLSPGVFDAIILIDTYH